MNDHPSHLKQACLILQEAAEEGFDWDSPFDAAAKVKEELEEIKEELKKPATPSRQKALQEETGDLFLACCCLARQSDVDPEEALLVALDKFMKRYARLKTYVKENGLAFQMMESKDISFLWQQLKENPLKD